MFHGYAIQVQDYGYIFFIINSGLGTVFLCFLDLGVEFLFNKSFDSGIYFQQIPNADTLSSWAARHFYISDEMVK